jgi:hypothetical protein
MSLAYSGKTLTAALVYASSAPATNDSIAAWLQYELVEGVNGYARYPSSSLGGGSYASGGARWEQSPIGVEFAAVGGNLTYTHVVLLIDAPADGQAGSAITASSGVNTSTDVITATAHGLTTSDAVTITADAGGSVPGGLTAGVRYFVTSVSANTVTLHTASPATSGNKVDITSTGSGTLRLRKCQGSVYGVMTESNATTVVAGQSVTYQVTLAVDD